MNACQGILEETRRLYQSVIDKEGYKIYENYHKDSLDYISDTEKKHFIMCKKWAEARQTRLKRELGMLMKNKSTWTTTQVITWLTSDDKLNCFKSSGEKEPS